MTTTAPALVTRRPLDVARKIVAVAVAGITSTGLITAAGLVGLEVAPEIASAIVTLLVFAAGYFTRERAVR